MFGRGVELVGVVELVLAGGVGEVWHGVGGERDVGRGAQAAAGARRTTPWRTDGGGPGSVAVVARIGDIVHFKNQTDVDHVESGLAGHDEGGFA